MSDPGTSYRTRDEIKKMKQSSDPIQGIKIRALEANLATEDDFKVYIADLQRWPNKGSGKWKGCARDMNNDGPHLSTDRSLQAIDADVKKQVDEAVIAAKASPEIGLDMIPEHIYQKPMQHVCRAGRLTAVIRTTNYECHEVLWIRRGCYIYIYIFAKCILLQNSVAHVGTPCGIVVLLLPLFTV